MTTTRPKPVTNHAWTPPCGHKVCRKLAECAFRPWTRPAEIRTGNCPDCGVWLQNGEAEHRRIVHGQEVGRRPAS